MKRELYVIQGKSSRQTLNLLAPWSLDFPASPNQENICDSTHPVCCNFEKITCIYFVLQKQQMITYENLEKKKKIFCMSFHTQRKTLVIFEYFSYVHIYTYMYMYIHYIHSYVYIYTYIFTYWGIVDIQWYITLASGVQYRDLTGIYVMLCSSHVYRLSPLRCYYNATDSIP